MSGNTFALAYPKSEFGMAVTINEKHASAKGNYSAEFARNIEVGWLAKSSPTMKGTIDHEMGHILHYSIDTRGRENLPAWIRSHGALPTSLSKYSNTNFKETIAEGWAEYNGGNPRPMAIEIGTWLTGQLPPRRDKSLTFPAWLKRTYRQ